MKLLDLIRENRGRWQAYADALASAGYGAESIRAELESMIETVVPVLAERADDAIDWHAILPDRLEEVAGWLEDRDGPVIRALLDLLVNAALSKISRQARATGSTRAAIRLRIGAAPIRRLAHPGHTNRKIVAARRDPAAVPVEVSAGKGGTK